jgi:hypothetical protein
MTIIQWAHTDTTRRALLHSASNDSIWYAETHLPLPGSQEDNIWVWNTPPRRINISLAYPIFNRNTRNRASWLTYDAFEKVVDLLQAPDLLFTRPCLADIMCREITTREILRPSPHPMYATIAVQVWKMTSCMNPCLTTTT